MFFLIIKKMSSHFKWYPGNIETIVPWNARYSFPSEANKAEKITPRIPPKNGGEFKPGDTLRLEFPAQGYVNPLHTTLEFDVVMDIGKLNTTASDSANDRHVRFQNNIQSIFQRVRLLYGSTIIEDIPGYNHLVRGLTEWTATNKHLTMDQTAVNEGIGGIVMDSDQSGETFGLVNVRTKYIQGYCDQGLQNLGDKTHFNGGVGWDLNTPVDSGVASADAATGVFNTITLKTIPPLFTPTANSLVGMSMYLGGDKDKAVTITANTGGLGATVTFTPALTSITTTGTSYYIVDQQDAYTITRRYQVSLALGLLTQEKLIPTKFMASQLAIEITLAQPTDCMIVTHANASNVEEFSRKPSYSVTHVNLIPEILQFDSSYDAMFLMGLKTDGVPIKFGSWHQHLFSSGGSNVMSFNIQERSRSVKALFAIQRRPGSDFNADSGAMFYDTGYRDQNNMETSACQSYQYRIGGRYFPSSPVQMTIEQGGSQTNGACEAYVELAKALNMMGDYRLSTSVNPANWAIQPTAYASGGYEGELPEYDYLTSTRNYTLKGAPVVKQITTADNCFAGTNSSGTFCMAMNLETTNGTEISGLNAEEQSDISLQVNYSASQNLGRTNQPAQFEVFVYFDTLMVLKENNVMEISN